MPTYKFQYFDVRGRGELARYVFTVTGTPFEDERLGGEKWQEAKPSTPFGQLPVLDVDGKKLAQSNAITRYLAREHGLAGTNSMDEAEIDQYVELVEDLFKEMFKGFFEKDEEKKKEVLKNLVEEVLPKFAGLFEKALERNGGKFFVGSDLTLADLAVFNGFDTPVLKSPTILDSFPALKAHRERIAALPEIAAYIKTRKHSDL